MRLSLRRCRGSRDSDAEYFSYFSPRLGAQSPEARLAFLCNAVLDLELLNRRARKRSVVSGIFNAEKLLQALYIRAS